MVCEKLNIELFESKKCKQKRTKKYSQIILLPHSHSTQKLRFPKKISKTLKVKKNVHRIYILSRTEKIWNNII